MCPNGVPQPKLHHFFSAKFAIKVSELQEKIDELEDDLAELQQQDFTLAIWRPELVATIEAMHMSSQLSQVLLKQSENTD